MQTPDLETLFLSQTQLIDRILQFINRRHHMSEDDAEEFRAEVLAKLVDNNYSVLASFQGKGSLKAYLSTVITHLYQDFRDKHWGRWRPSRKARNIGDTAVLWETLVRRDGYGFHQAAQIMRTNHGIRIGDQTLEELAALLPVGPPKTRVGEEALREVPKDAAGPVAQVALRQKHQRQTEFEAALAQLQKALPAEDRLILKLRFEDGLSVARISKVLNLEQKPLYRRLEKILSGHRRSLEGAGFSRLDIEEAFGELHE